MESSLVALQLAYHITRERLGRRRLAKRAGLTEMVVRAELERMRSSGWIRIQRAGVEWTSAGKRAFAQLLDPIRHVDDLSLKSLQLDRAQIGALLSDSTPPPAWQLRDAAIREGATGVMLMLHDATGWVFSHDFEPVRQRNPEDADEIERVFADAGEGDLLLIVFAPARRQAGRGLWRGVQTIQHHDDS